VKFFSNFWLLWWIQNLIIYLQFSSEDPKNKILLQMNPQDITQMIRIKKNSIQSETQTIEYCHMIIRFGEWKSKNRKSASEIIKLSTSQLFFGIYVEWEFPFGLFNSGDELIIYFYDKNFLCFHIACFQNILFR